MNLGSKKMFTIIFRGREKGKHTEVTGILGESETRQQLRTES